MKSTEMMLYHEAYGLKIKEVPIDYSFVESDRNLPKGKIFYTLKTATLGLLDVWKSCKGEVIYPKSSGPTLNHRK